MRVTEPFARRATLSRSARLLAEFRFEQRDPARFYTALAADTAAMVGDLWRGCRRTVPRARPCSTWAAVRLLRLGIHRRRLALHRGRARPTGDARRGQVRAGTGDLRAGIGSGAAVPGPQRRCLPVVQRRRTRRTALATRGGDAAGDQARRIGDPVPARCGSARSAATRWA